MRQQKITRREALKYTGTLLAGAAIGATGIRTAAAMGQVKNQNENMNMSKKILALSASARKNGNSSTLCNEFLRGAKEAGHETEKIFICDKKINGCLGCLACQENGGECIRKDDMTEIYEKLLAADAVVYASPVYFYSFRTPDLLFIKILKHSKKRKHYTQTENVVSLQEKRIKKCR
ncbi:MAG: flavodoxin family protein, partial [Tannerella sp.]|nr:flavodoxin family protein [Tannerella sp.]